MLTNTLNVGSVAIKGYVKTGPVPDSLYLGLTNSVGDRSFVEGGNTGIQPGHSATDFNVIFPDVVLPSTIWQSKTPDNGSVNGTNYQYIFNTSGDYRLTAGISANNGNIYIGTNVSVRLKID